MNSKRLGVKKNTRIDKLYMIHGLRTTGVQEKSMVYRKNLKVKGQ